MNDLTKFSTVASLKFVYKIFWNTDLFYLNFGFPKLHKTKYLRDSKKL